MNSFLHEWGGLIATAYVAWAVISLNIDLSKRFDRLEVVLRALSDQIEAMTDRLDGSISQASGEIVGGLFDVEKAVSALESAEDFAARMRSTDDL